MNRFCCFLLAGLLSLAACTTSTPRVELAGRVFEVEVADEPEERALGLMFREHLEPDAGMLFIFGEEARRSFWMKNCRIPLDILYFDGEFRLINAHYRVPPCHTARCPGYPSHAPARYVLEVSGGVAESLELAPGDRLHYQP